MDIFIGVVVGLLVLMLLVTVHEFGHFLAARKNGVNVLEFGIGFPPRAVAWIKDPKTGKWRYLPRKDWHKDKMTKVVYSSGKHKDFAQKGMIFSLNWLPIGGFCQMDGESDAETRKGTMGAASFWAKTQILFAGVAMNWLVAIIIFTILAWTGMPEFIENQFTVPVDSRVDWVPVQIEEVVAESPAEKAGLKKDDYILSVDGESVTYASDVTNITNEHTGETVNFKVVRGLSPACARELDWQSIMQEQNNTIPACENTSDNQNSDKTPALIVSADVTLNEKDSEYLVGVRMVSSERKTYSTWSAPIVGVGLTAQLTGETFRGVGEMIWNLITGVGSQLSPDQTVRENGQEAITTVGESVSGPVGIIGVLFPAFTAAGPTNLAFLTALISVSLACMNVLPIPALDGGRWLLIAIFKLRHKKLTKEIEEKIVSRAFIVLLALIFIVTILDIIRIVQ